MQKIKEFLKNTRGVGGNEAIEWVMVLFLVSILGGSSIYVIATFLGVIDEGNATEFLVAVMDVFQTIPDWLQILVIVGFASAIGLVGLAVYGVFKKKSGSM